MQSPKLILISFILCSFTFAVNVQESNAQATPSKITKGKDTMLINLEQEQYPEFRNIHNLNKYANVTYTGLDSSSARLSKFSLQIDSPRLKLKALYHKDGRLIRGIMVKKDTKLPTAIYRSLARVHYNGWAMISNKTVVVNFNPSRTQYMVKMQKGEQEQTLYFNSYGAPINRLTYLPRFASFEGGELALANFPKQ